MRKTIIAAVTKMAMAVTKMRFGSSDIFDNIPCNLIFRKVENIKAARPKMHKKPACYTTRNDKTKNFNKCRIAAMLLPYGTHLHANTKNIL